MGDLTRGLSAAEIYRRQREGMFDLSGAGTQEVLRRAFLDPSVSSGKPWGPYREIVLPPTNYTFGGMSPAQLITWIDSNGGILLSADGKSRVAVPAGSSVAYPPVSVVVAEDAAVRQANGIPPRAPGEPIYSWPRSGSEIELSDGFRRVDRPLFASQNVVFSARQDTVGRDAPIGDQLMPGERSILVAASCPEASPEPKTTSEWKKHDVQVYLRSRSGQRIPGPTLSHYADLSLARWWFEIALALASDNRIIARLDTVSMDNGRFPQQDQSGGWNPTGWYAQVHYVRAICEAISNAYNALNIPWYNDPVARALYRDWFAGHDADEFDARSNYNSGNWFTNREQCGEKRYTVLRARIPSGSWTNTGVGELPARLDRLWSESHAPGNTRTLEFLQKAGVMLWSANESTDPYIATSAYNRGYASGFAMGWDVFYASPLALSRVPTEAERALYRNSSKRLGDAIGQDMSWDLSDSKPTAKPDFFSDDWYARIVHAPPLQDRNNICDWRAAGFDPAGTAGVHVQGAVPLRWYLTWLREWATACTTIAPVDASLAPELPEVDAARRWPGFGTGVMPRRTPGVILRDARSYALEINLTWAQILGSNERFTQALNEKASSFNRANPNAIVRGIGQAVNAIGAPVINAFVPGVGALAGAGVSLVADLLSFAIPSYDCTGYGRDDLGRPKPNFERVSLSGDVAKSVPPSVSVPVPFGFCRGNDRTPDVIPISDQSPVPQDETKAEGLSTIAKVGLVAAGVGTIALAAWAINKPKIT